MNNEPDASDSCRPDPFFPWNSGVNKDTVLAVPLIEGPL
jgi:hypothetical protein